MTVVTAIVSRVVVGRSHAAPESDPNTQGHCANKQQKR
jgi:hypothetical protein